MCRLPLLPGLLLTVLLTVLPAAARLAVPALTGPCVDKAGMLTPADRARIASRMERVAQTTGGQMAVLTIPTLGTDDSLEDYSLRVAETWGLGHAGKDNGALLLIVRDDRLTRLEIGYGWEGTVNDARAGDLLRDLAPFLRAGRTADGIVHVAAGLEAYITGGIPPALPPELTPQTLRSPQIPQLSLRQKTALTIGIAVFILLLIVSPTFRRIVFYLLLSVRFSGGNSGGGFRGGGGRFGGGGASGKW